MSGKVWVIEEEATKPGIFTPDSAKSSPATQDAPPRESVGARLEAESTPQLPLLPIASPLAEEKDSSPDAGASRLPHHSGVEGTPSRVAPPPFPAPARRSTLESSKAESRGRTGKRGPTSREHPRERTRESALPLIVAYLAGPFGVLATREGRRTPAWAIAGTLFGIAWLSLPLMPWRWEDPLFRLEDGSFAILLWLLITSVLTLGGFTAWARGVYLAARGANLWAFRPPSWLKSPWTVGASGFLVPGLGFVLTSRPVQAAVSLWAAGLLVQAWLILGSASWLWSWNQGSGSYGIPPHALELMFVMSGAVGLIGALVWIMQALSAAHGAASTTTHSPTPRAAWIAAALVVALAAFVVVFDPVSLADELDHCAVTLHGEGFRAVPLYLSLAAARLDPSRPEYGLHAAELHASAGRHHAAWRIRRAIDTRMRPYLTQLRKEGLLPEERRPAEEGLPFDETASRPPATYAPLPRAEDTAPPGRQIPFSEEVVSPGP